MACCARSGAARVIGEDLTRDAAAAMDKALFLKVSSTDQGSAREDLVRRRVIRRRQA
jgi:hypothetical protein